MTDDEYLAASLAIERRAHERIAILSTVSARSRPRAGESNVIHDAVAALAKRERNAATIVEIEAAAAYEQECLEAHYYGLPIPPDRPERPEIV